MKVGSLFSGGGLGDFGFLAAGMEIAWQCEIDPYCQKILTLRYPESKKYTDIKLLKGTEIEKVDIITGGFPCQPFSTAGKRGGADDNRYLWPEMLRIIKENKPRWVIGENVTGIITLAIDFVCASLEKEGYTVQTIVFPAHALGAWHRRDRVWIVAHARSVKPGRLSGKQRKEIPAAGAVGKTLSNTTIDGRFRGRAVPGKKKAKRTHTKAAGYGAWRRYWQLEPAVGRVVNGASNRVHRLKMLGNGQVPACTYVIGKMIMDIENGQ